MRRAGDEGEELRVVNGEDVVKRERLVYAKHVDKGSHYVWVASRGSRVVVSVSVSVPVSVV